MSNLLKINNFDEQNLLGQTTLEADVATGVSSLSVNNAKDFASGTNVLLGNQGSNGAELLVAGTIANDYTLPLTSPTTLPHSSGEQVNSLFGTQIRIYTAADTLGTGQAPPDANFSLLATVNIDATSSETSYTDSTGTATTWYKYTYYNLTSSTETSLSDTQIILTPEVAAQNKATVNYCTLDQIRGAAGFKNNANITDDLIEEKRQAAQNSINGALIPVYVFPLPQPTNPIITELTMKLAASYLMQQVFRTTNPATVTQAKQDEDDLIAGPLNELVLKQVVLVNATFIDQTIPGGNGVSGYPDDTLGPPNVEGEGGYSNFGSQGGPPHSIFYPGKVY